MSQPAPLNVSEILDRMKTACAIGTDAQLADHLQVSNKTVSSWRTRNSVPIEAIIQISDETGRTIDYLLYGEDRAKLDGQQFMELFRFDDLRIKDFELAGESIFPSILSQFAPEELAFMSDEDLSRHGKALGSSILRTLALLRHERRSLFDTGKMSEDAFDQYVRASLSTSLDRSGA